MEAQEGYDQDRFISAVPRRLVCGICYHVLREPRLCHDGEHYFCLSCISRSLNESQTCPQCRKPLTLETLTHPQSYLRETLGELIIKCDYIERGCPNHVQLGNLKDHVSHCGFAPVTCEKCGMLINRKDKDNHEKSLCQLGSAKCQDCGDIKANQDHIKQELCQMKARQIEIKSAQDDMKASLDNIITEQLNAIICEQEDYIQIGRSLNTHQEELKRKYDQMENDVSDMKQHLQHFTEKFTPIADRLLSNFSSSNNEIIIMGGENENNEIQSSVSIFNPANGTYEMLSPMSHARKSASSCVYNNDVIIAGGYGEKGALDTIEILKINQNLPRWTKSKSKLPSRLHAHILKVYQEKLLVIGGYNCDTKKVSNEINQLALEWPYTPTLLTTMPQPRMYHTAEIVNDKLFILGGQTTKSDGDALDSVTIYDFITNEFKTSPLLPKPVCRMSSVTLGSKIIVIGGSDTKGKALNDVIVYHTESESSDSLPSLKQYRVGPCSVVINDVIVVLGGLNSKQKHLDSVESFTMGSDCWKKIPQIKVGRSYATAVVKT